MRSALIHRFSTGGRRFGALCFDVLESARVVWDDLAHLFGMDKDQLSALGLEQMLTTSELAEYLGVKVQAIYDLRSEGRGPIGIPVGGGLRFRASDVRAWLDDRREGALVETKGGEL